MSSIPRFLRCWNLGNTRRLQRSRKLLPEDVACGTVEVEIAKLQQGRGGLISQQIGKWVGWLVRGREDNGTGAIALI